MLTPCRKFIAGFLGMKLRRHSLQDWFYNDRVRCPEPHSTALSARRKETQWWQENHSYWTVRKNIWAIMWFRSIFRVSFFKISKICPVKSYLCSEPYLTFNLQHLTFIFILCYTGSYWWISFDMIVLKLDKIASQGTLNAFDQEVRRSLSWQTMDAFRPLKKGT